MEASGLILNLVQKAGVKTEDDAKLSTSCGYGNNRNVSSFDQASADRNSISSKVAEKSSEHHRENKEAGESMFEVSLATSNEDSECDKENAPRKKIRVVSKQICNNEEPPDERKIFVLQQLGQSQIRSEEFPAFLCIDGRIADSSGVKRKIPRPANAFMLFANEWRKKLAAENPRESNKDISVRLGILWKNMAKDVKEKYFAMAREVDAEHKRKYPEALRSLPIRLNVGGVYVDWAHDSLYFMPLNVQRLNFDRVRVAVIFFVYLKKRKIPNTCITSVSCD